MAARSSPDGRKSRWVPGDGHRRRRRRSDPSCPADHGVVGDRTGVRGRFQQGRTRVVAGSGNSEVWIWQIGKREPDVVLRSFPGGVRRALPGRPDAGGGGDGEPSDVVARPPTPPSPASVPGPVIRSARDEWAKHAGLVSCRPAGGPDRAWAGVPGTGGVGGTARARYWVGAIDDDELPPAARTWPGRWWKSADAHLVPGHHRT